jgi:hypothetical protein
MELDPAPIRNATSALLDDAQDRLLKATRAMLSMLPKPGASLPAADLIGQVARQTHDRQVAAWAFWSLVHSGHMDLDFDFQATRTARKLPRLA